MGEDTAGKQVEEQAFEFHFVWQEDHDFVSNNIEIPQWEN